ncbi:hypothetical protein T440DRAFT_548436 [Plenodomus tracheiphilus IPT5]|uniref:Uncharacterized protein n=1 Tax=Plenodomus tracheiphilus IPT5 TaxID=1408161 RepID=A0A6A7AMT2_9PLEO|nr:hypothetical protein T440DRAFT_548436 [Plenodomus tracheiphilus IPT5]
MTGNARPRKRQRKALQRSTYRHLQAAGIDQRPGVPKSETSVAPGTPSHIMSCSTGASRATFQDTIRNGAKELLPCVPQSAGCGRDEILAYLHSFGAMYLLDNIPGADQVHFVEQDHFRHARPKKLLIGRHAQSGDDIYAYMTPMKTVHRVDFYTENARGCTELHTGHKRIPRNCFVYPFNRAFPNDLQIIRSADIARLALLVKWYFISAGFVQACVLEEGKSFVKRFYIALRYIASHSSSAPVAPLHEQSALRPPDSSTCRKQRAPDRYMCESDIQASLLQMYPPLARPTTADVLQSLGRSKAPLTKATAVKFQLPSKRRSSSKEVISEANRLPEAVDRSKPIDSVARLPRQSSDQPHISLQTDSQSSNGITMQPGISQQFAARQWYDCLKGWILG